MESLTPKQLRNKYPHVYSIFWEDKPIRMDYNSGREYFWAVQKWVKSKAQK